MIPSESSDTANTALTQLAALERFIDANDDLLELEERIGRFNIFDALSIARAEIRHSNFLAWILDPNESHGQGALFLKAVLMDLFKQAKPTLRPLSPVELDGVELGRIEIHREWRGIDLLIGSESPAFIVAIENKIDSGEHSNQLNRYKTIVRENFVNVPVSNQTFVYLTTRGVHASSDDWVPYSYRDIHRVLSRCQRTNAGGIGHDVSAFLDHYLRLIGSRFMDDPKIDELCKRLYQNHRQAFDLVFEHGRLANGLGPEIGETIKQHPGRWHLIHAGPNWIDFSPLEWHDYFLSLGDMGPQGPDRLIRAWIDCSNGRCVWSVEVGPFNDRALRKRVIERLTANPKEFGFQVRPQAKPGRGEYWTRLVRKREIDSWAEDEEPNREAICKKVEQTLNLLAGQLAGVLAALQPLFDNWRANQGKAISTTLPA